MSTEEYVIQKALDRFYADGPPCKIAESLPLVEEFSQNYVPPDVFKGMNVLFIQHHLGPFIPKLQITTDWGLEPSKSCARYSIFSW